MSQFLFLFTIGPVQSYISQARKTQDLYAGSFLLSHLSDAAIDELSRLVDSCDIIFPDKEIDSKPNRFIAKIECEDPEKIGSELCNFVQNEYRKICGDIVVKLNLNIPDGFGQQIDNLLDLHWIALDFKEGDYASKFSELESYLGAVKNIRRFQQFQESGRKCSLCGERNVLFYGGDEKRAYVQDAKKVTHVSNKFISDGEGLCAVCLSKRFAGEHFKKKYQRNYPSTAEIALMDTLSKLDSSLLKEYKSFFGKDFDEQLYFKDNLTKKYFEKNGIKADPEVSLEKLAKITNTAEQMGLKFSNYYALLCLDGDNMGKWLSGEFLEDKGKSELERFHSYLTEKLGTYTDKVEDIVDSEVNPKGKLVYSGGDDVLAFINLNYLLPVMKELRKNFPAFEEFSYIKQGEKSSASCGVCIAHYKTPLQEVLSWARKMEHEAKSIDGNNEKDAFAIAVLKRSGEIHKTVFKWKYETLDTIEVLEELINLLRSPNSSGNPSFSDSFVKKLNEEFNLLMDENDNYTEFKLLKTEIKRLISRSCMMVKKTGETETDFYTRKEQTIEDITEKLYALAIESKSLENFLSLLNTTVFIERGSN
ncbi:CRISPR-associated protein, Cmr2 family [Methanosarcina thermophila]|uniref:CRISPR-associated protein, Cmr2 family n=1 Tax=Methanosarcina thermophila TaxID=2210 RepID=A0A3G9CS26_METTE|nr:CRISPR-associated protein, Cmr2 family [Methanosarcina thermophila]